MSDKEMHGEPKTDANFNQGCGILFVLSAPSGTGKTTLANYLVNHLPDMIRSISYTTRKIRGGEKEGVDYHFVDHATFEKMIEEKAFAEYAKVHDNYYGTALKTITEAKDHGDDILLVIDVQGAATLANQNLDSVSIFLLPPSMKELRERLGNRGTDSEEAINKRIKTALKEIEACGNYDYIVVNDKLSKTEGNLAGIVWAERCKTHRNNTVFSDYSLPTQIKGKK